MKEYQDYYFRKAKAENYPARSVYKLQELDSRFRLLSRKMRVLDLGSAPGSWTLFCSQRAGSEGQILSCDLKPLGMDLPANVHFEQRDVLQPEFGEFLIPHAPFDVVLSDMAPATTGNRFVDQARSAQLVEVALAIAIAHLKIAGHFVAKIFMGPDSQRLTAEMRKYFDKVKSFKPKSSRAESFETFLIGMGRKIG